MRTRLVFSLAVAALCPLVAGCGGASMPAGVGASGPPGGLAAKTFAGQNRCNPQNHERPFIIEWDATDQASFQSYAASDVVVVRYEGCDLKPLDGCRVDNAKGQYGAYKPVEWTSGGLETIDIHDEGELYARLPLGAADLSAKVEGGEKLHMEYYVSGTRTATRDKLYRGELAENPACAGATHFVYAYNLGAFAIAAASSLKAEAHGSYFGFGAGGRGSSGTNADKKGGDLAACQGESAKEVDACKVPIRLTLRTLHEGSDPAKLASTGAVSDAALNAVGQVKAASDAEKKAQAVLQSAETKKQSGDGNGCLADLDEHDRLDPRPGTLSTSPASGQIAGLRGECLMLAGQCDAGKVAFRKAMEATKGGEIGPERMDAIVQAEAGQYCRGAKMADKDQYIAAMTALRNGGLGISKKTRAECQAAFDAFMTLHPKFRGDGTDPSLPKNPFDAVALPAAGCFAKAGDCAGSFKAYKALMDAKGPKDGWKPKDEKAARAGFDGMVEECAGQ